MVSTVAAHDLAVGDFSEIGRTAGAGLLVDVNTETRPVGGGRMWLSTTSSGSLTSSIAAGAVSGSTNLLDYEVRCSEVDVDAGSGRYRAVGVVWG